MDLKAFILRQFRSVSGGSLYEQWLATVQSTTVEEYQKRFIETVAPLERVSEEMLMGQFLNGLKEDIRAEVRLLSPLSLEQTMEMALRVEENNKAVRIRRNLLSSYKAGSISAQTKGPPTSVGSLPSPVSVRSWATGAQESRGSVNGSKYLVGRNFGEVKRLKEKELQEKKAKELCFRCDDKWAIGHRCRRKELSVILVEEEDEDTTDETRSKPPQSPIHEQTQEVNLHPEVSLNSVIGISNPKTMKLKGWLFGKEVVVLIYPGATHNFVSLDKWQNCQSRLQILVGSGYHWVMENP